jgi:hypothetical protein
LTCDAPASVISDESAEGEIALAFCDPTQSNAGNITIELDKSAVYIAEKDAGIEVLSVMPKIKLRVQAKGDGGKVYKIRLKTGGGYNPPYIKIANLGDGDKIKSGANPFKIVVDAFTKSIEIAKVEFFANGEKIGESAAPPYSFNWPNIPAGEINLTARAVDLAGGYSEDAVKVTGGGYSYYLTDKWKAEFDNYYTTDRSVQPINWNTFDVSGNGIFTADGGALRVTQPETDGSVSGYIYPGAYGGGRRFSLSVKFEGKNVSRDIFNVKISDSLFVKFLNFRSDGNAYLSKRPSPDLLLFEYEENKWYDIVMEFNLSEKKYYLYINGEAYASNEPIPFGSGLAGIENIKFTQYSYAGVSGAMTIRSVTSATVNDGASPIRGIRLWGLKSVSGDGFARLSVNASDIDGGINRVEFYIGDNLAGTSLKPPYSYNYRGNGDVFRARAVANDGRELLSGPENVAEFSLSEAPAADADLVYAVNAFGLPPRNGDMAYGKARIQNNAPEAVTVYAYASGGKLYKSAEPAVIQPGQSDVISLDGLAFGGEYKIFLWDENQKPYCGVLK